MASPTDSRQVHVMVDLETLSTKANATIVSIGAVKFTLGSDEQQDFYINVDAKSCKDRGLHIDKKTVEWWQKQKPEALKALMVDPVDIEDALEAFTQFIGNDQVMIWGNGASFDVTILEEAYEACGISNYPWKHWNIMCFRTVMNLFGLKNSDIRAAENDVHHHALDDAKSQANTLLKILKS